MDCVALHCWYRGLVFVWDDQKRERFEQLRVPGRQLTEAETDELAALVRERDVGSELTVDHFQPRSKGGMDEPSNWVYRCHACNEFKGDFFQTDSIQRILHPTNDKTAPHLVEDEDGTLRGLTETGTFHI